MSDQDIREDVLRRAGEMMKNIDVFPSEEEIENDPGVRLMRLLEEMQQEDPETFEMLVQSFLPDDEQTRMVEPEVEAAGIEPARDSGGNAAFSSDFRAEAVHRQQGDEPVRLAASLEREMGEPLSSERDGPRPSRDFSVQTAICGIDFEIKREGKHLNLHAMYFDRDLVGETVWQFEEITPNLIERLRCLYEAALLAQEVSEDGTG